MKLELKHWQHAFLSISILILGLLFLYYLLVSPALASRLNFNERRGELELQLAKYKKAEQQLIQLKNQISQLNNNSSQKAYFLENKPDTLAAADLQKRLKTLIESHDGQIVSTQPIVDQDNDLFSKVTVKLHMRGNINTLQETLYALEFSRPLLFVDNIIIQNRARRSASTRNQPNADPLDIRLDVTGYIFKPST